MNNEKRSNKINTVIAVFNIAIILLAVICVYSGAHPFSKSRMRYECVFEDGFTVNDVSSNYKVVEQRGDIVVLEDR